MTAIVLVEPSLPENVGAAARALANFGLTDLRLVAPAGGEAWATADHPRAVAAAAHGTPVLAAARTYATLAEALADRNRVWATTARTPEVPLPSIGPRALGVALRTAEADGAAPAVVFGPERTGLRYEHLARVDALVTVPTAAACPSLNLGVAVGIVAWERAAADEQAGGSAAGPIPAPRAAFDAWFDTLAAAIDRAGYFSDPTLRVRALRNLRGAFARAGFTEGELHTLRGVVRALGR